MADRLSRDWWLIALQGVSAILFGVFALVMPGLTLLALVFLFGAYALMDGVLALTRGLRRSEGGGPDWWRILHGGVGIAAGVIAFAIPGLTAYALLVLIAARALVAGAIGLVAAFQLRDAVRSKALLALEGIVAMLFGLALVVFPGAGALAVVWMIGSFAIASGVILLTIAFRLRGRRGGTRTPAPVPRPSPS